MLFELSKSLAGVKALIVEDSPTQAMQLVNTLEKAEVNVVASTNGTEAIQKLNIENPQIIISDIEMPEMNGYEFCKQVKSNEQFAHIPVILLTHLSNTNDVIKGIECGADSFMTKPYDSRLLLMTMGDVLRNQSNRKSSKLQKLEVYFRGQRHLLNVNQSQICDLLLSTYTNAIQKNFELEQACNKLTQISQELKKKNEELIKSNDQKNLFLGMAAHDLRNPLNVIAGYSSLVLKTLHQSTKENVKDMLRHIQRSSAFMVSLINDLLDISVIEAGQIKLKTTEVDLAALLKEQLTLESLAAEKKNIKLNFNVSKDLPKVICDPDKIIQVFNNLISNALKFSYPDSKIDIRLEATSKDVTVIIQDYGIGIAPEEKEKLFQPFSKLSTKGTIGEVSTGLGLAIAYKIITSHNGKIWVESEKGKGSIFYIQLPIAQTVDSKIVA